MGEQLNNYQLSTPHFPLLKGGRGGLTLNSQLSTLNTPGHTDTTDTTDNSAPSPRCLPAAILSPPQLSNRRFNVVNFQLSIN